MDETSARFFYPPKAGMVVIPKDTKKRHLLEKEHVASLSIRRSMFTYLSFVCDDPDIQKYLPQIVLVSQRAVPQRDFNIVQNWLVDRPGLLLWRRKSSWVTSAMMIEITALLAKCLRQFDAEVQFLWLIDCAPVHSTPEVVRAIARAGIYVVYIPAGMTSYLQPLDVYVFSQLKKNMRESFERVSLRTTQGTVSTVQVLCLTFLAIRAVVQHRTWRHAFVGCGFGENQRLLGQRLRRRLDWVDAVPPVSGDLPTLAQLQSIFPGSRAIPLGWLFHLVTQRESCRLADPSKMTLSLSPVLSTRASDMRSVSSSSSCARALAQETSAASSSWQMTERSSVARPVEMRDEARETSEKASTSQASASQAHPLRVRVFPVGRPLFPHRRLGRIASPPESRA